MSTEAEKYFEDAFEHALVGMALVHLDGRPFRVNRAFVDMLGYGQEEAANMSVFQFTHPEDSETSRESLRRLIGGEIPSFSLEKRYLHKRGHVTWGVVSVSLIRDRSGQPSYLVAHVQDITERKHIEESLRENEQRFRMLAETVSFAIFIFQGTVLRFVNSAAVAMTEYGCDELLAMPFWQIIHRDYRDLVRERGLARQRGESIEGSYEVKILTKSGVERWVEFSGAAFEFEGKPAVLGTAFDVTARKRAEEHLRYRLAFEALVATLASDFINLGPQHIDAGIETALRLVSEFVGVDRAFLCLFSADGQTFDWTHRWAAAGYALPPESYRRVPAADFAWTVERLRAGGVVTLRTPDELPAPAASERALLRALGVRSVVCVPLRRQDRLVGFVGFSSVRIERLWSDDETALLRIVAGMFVNALQRKQSAEALQRSEERFALAVAGANDGVWDWDAATDTLYHSPRLLGMLGYDEAEISDRLDEWRARVHPDDYERVIADLSRYLEGTSPHYESEHRLLHKDGTYRYVLVRGMSLRDGAGVMQRMVGSLTDVTMRKQAEQEARQREAELAHVLRVTTMGEMAASLAHEINQPLASIVNYAKGCTRRLRSGEGVSAGLLDALDQIASESLRAGEIISRLRTFIRKEPPRRDWTDLNDLVTDVAHLVEPEAHEREVTLQLDLAPHLPRMQVDAIQIEQVIVNLVRNAFEAMLQGNGVRRALTIATRSVEDGTVEVAVSDTGEGLPPSAAEHLFEPFFTTKPNGLGMGLSISRSIVSAHGGRLWAVPSGERGATFRFVLPTAKAPADEPRGH